MQSIGDATAFITGGASGIGLGIARALAEKGARIAVADIRDDHLESARQLAADEGWGDRYLGLPLDITDRAAFGDALAACERRFGPLRILINNAGVGIAGPVAEATYADWDWGLSVNLGGVINGVVSGLPLLRRHGGEAHMVVTASLGAMMPARPTRGVYATAKAGLIALSEHLRLELEATPVGISILLPGPTLSNIHESERVRPDHLRAGSRFRSETDGSEPRPTGIAWRDPLIVGRMTVDAILRDRFYIVSHPEYLGAVKARHAAIEAAIEDMGPIDD